MAALRQDAPSDADLWSAELVVAELLSNAVTHTAGPAFVSLEWDGEHPRLKVADTGPGFTGLSSSTANSPVPAGDADTPGQATPMTWPQLPADPLAEGGRGLYLVSRLALEIEVAAGRHGGSQVSVTLDVDRPT
jgi:anti-sigma regulatory factor (Ser/Thr protein kinase)